MRYKFASKKTEDVVMNHFDTYLSDVQGGPVVVLNQVYYAADIIHELDYGHYMDLLEKYVEEQISIGELEEVGWAIYLPGEEEFENVVQLPGFRMTT